MLLEMRLLWVCRAPATPEAWQVSCSDNTVLALHSLTVKVSTPSPQLSCLTSVGHVTCEQGQLVETKAQECLQLRPCMGSDILRTNETLRNRSQSFPL